MRPELSPPPPPGSAVLFKSAALGRPRRPGPRLTREALVWPSLQAAQGAPCPLRGPHKWRPVGRVLLGLAWRIPHNVPRVPRIPAHAGFSPQGRATSHRTGRPHSPGPPAAGSVSEQTSPQDPAVIISGNCRECDRGSGSVLSSLTTAPRCPTTARTGSGRPGPRRGWCPLPESGRPVASRLPGRVCTSLTGRDLEHLCMCLWPSVCLLAGPSNQVLCPPLTGLLLFLLLICRRSLCISMADFLSDV